MVKKQRKGIIVLVCLLIAMVSLIGIMITYDYESERYKPDVVYTMANQHITWD